MLLACLFHDIGKGANGGVHHAGGRGTDRPGGGRTLGIVGEDAELVERLVREHLTLVELATRRDHTDPATVDALVGAVDGRAEVLSLLRLLTEADARAAGPAAWTPWRAQLINDLADRSTGYWSASRLIRTLGVRRSRAGTFGPGRRQVPRIRLEVQAGRESARDRRDRSARVCSATPPACCVAHGIQCVRPSCTRSRASRSTPGGSTSSRPRSCPNSRSWSRSSNDSRPETAPCSGRFVDARRGPRADGAVPTRTSRWSPMRASTAAVVEVRTADRSGLLYALGRALSDGRTVDPIGSHLDTGRPGDRHVLSHRAGRFPAEGRAGRGGRAFAESRRRRTRPARNRWAEPGSPQRVGPLNESDLALGDPEPGQRTFAAPSSESTSAAVGG